MQATQIELKMKIKSLKIQFKISLEIFLKEKEIVVVIGRGRNNMRLYSGRTEHTCGLGSANVHESSWVSFLHGKNDI